MNVIKITQEICFFEWDNVILQAVYKKWRFEDDFRRIRNMDAAYGTGRGTGWVGLNGVWARGSPDRSGTGIQRLT